MWRRKIALFGAALLASSVFCCAEGPFAVFWNLECFFDPFDDPAVQDEEYTPSGRRHWSWKQFCRKRDGIAKTLASTADVAGRLPDLICLAEVENRMVLRQLAEETLLLKADYGIVHRNSPDRRGMDVALLYRRKFFRVLHVEALNLSEGKPTRDILYVKGIFREKDTVHLFVNHWPSKLGGAGALSMRMAAAGRLCSVADSVAREEPGSRIIAVGDFNDTPENTSPLLEPVLESLCDSLSMAGVGTIKYQGEWELIDQAFCRGPAMEMKIYSPPFLMEEDKAYTGLRPRRTFLGPRNHGGLSDHLPILLVPMEQEP